MGVAGFWWHWLSAQYPELGLEDAAGSWPFETWAAPGTGALSRMGCRDRAMERRCWNRAEADREALREELHSGKDTRPGNASGG